DTPKPSTNLAGHESANVTTEPVRHSLHHAKDAGHKAIEHTAKQAREHYKSLKIEGDTLWRHAQVNLTEKLHRAPTVAETSKAVKRILIENNLTWEKARHLAIGFRFKT